ncbi:YpoC family protein [Amphibacillus sediminis]|uniref:YpoC family protein n=1 Tax=Amphibacillus sediminis TaxID=360185 RepID=UPI0008355D27|nr:hypothetical protein [Amphibacillus sediminis]
MKKLDPFWVESWKEVSRELTHLYQTKQYDKTIEPMKSYIHIFLTALYQLNQLEQSEANQPLIDLNKLKHAPINLSERIDYIQSNPSQYHAYIQLNALFNELEKLYAKVSIMSKYT